MIKLNERIKQLRKKLNLSQTEFGKKIGIKDASVSRIEKGERNPSEQTIKSICREFKVNYTWLMDGVGEMFSNLPETILDELAEEYNLSDFEKTMVRNYITLPENERAIFEKFAKKFLLNLKGE